MKKLLTLGLLLACVASAQTVTRGDWPLYSGRTIVSRHPTEAACIAAAQARGPAGARYFCDTRLTIVTAAPPPPVNCQVSDWSAWTETWRSAPTNGQVTVNETRTRTVLTPASGGGTPCPALSEERTRTETVPLNWTRVAGEGQEFRLNRSAMVRYGAPGGYAVLTLPAGLVRCSNSTFNGDPIFGAVKACDVDSPDAVDLATPPPVVVPPPTTPTNPAPPPQSSGIPYVNPSLIPAPVAGFSDIRIGPAPRVGEPNGPTPQNNDFAFRVPIKGSHFAFDDPIIYPGRVGASHLHEFYGNTGANAHSTTESLMTTGNSTSAGGIANRTAYWVPAIIDTRTGAPVRGGGIFYYKKPFYMGPVSDVRPPPTGLRIIGGRFATSTGEVPNQPNPTFQCHDLNFNPIGPATMTIPDCDPGQMIKSSLDFPFCWDGVNLDSPDHRSHMSYAWFTPGRCPASHPVVIPNISLQIFWRLPDGARGRDMRLSSDAYPTSTAGGWSMHADIWMAWNEQVKATWHQHCVLASMDCHAYNLGNGTELRE